MKNAIGVLSLWLIGFSVLAGDDLPKAKVISVIDGNTLTLLNSNGEQFKLILYGIDSPDSGQNFAMEAKKALTSMLLNKEVIIIPHGKDRYGNLLGEVKPDNNTDVNFELLVAGLAWTTEQNDELESLKEHARARGVGLWADENPMPPWLWRRHQSMMQSKSN